MTEVARPISVFALIAAGAWVIVPVAWSIGADMNGPINNVLFMVGWTALIVAGVFTLVAILQVAPKEERGGWMRAGMLIHGLALVVSLLTAWFVLLWAALYSAAMALYARGLPQVRRAMIVISGAMGAAVASFVVLTVLEVGTPDSYGDYPVAWATAYFVAAIGAAIGALVLSRQDVSSTSDVPVVAG